jgi:hypothetical protein
MTVFLNEKVQPMLLPNLVFVRHCYCCLVAAEEIQQLYLLAALALFAAGSVAPVAAAPADY